MAARARSVRRRSSASAHHAARSTPPARSPSRRKPRLTQGRLRLAANEFVRRLNQRPPERLVRLAGLSKQFAVVFEEMFKDELEKRFLFQRGNPALGVDLPDVNTDIKVTSVTQPQSSAPFAGTEEKVYGLPYNILLFVYVLSKEGGERRIVFQRPRLIPRRQTGDWRVTGRVREIALDRMLSRREKQEMLREFLEGELVVNAERALLPSLVRRIIKEPPAQGLLTLSSALQWRCGYKKAIEKLSSDGDGRS